MLRFLPLSVKAGALQQFTQGPCITMLQCTPHFVDLKRVGEVLQAPHRSHPCSPVSREDRAPCVRDRGEPWGSLPLSVTGTRSNTRAAAATCRAPLNHRMNWVGRDLRYHLVPTTLPFSGTPPTRSGCPGPHPAWP